jgi:TolA-binding protein
LTSTRILARRRLGATAVPAHVSAPPRRRRRTRGFVQVATAAASERLRLNVLGHAYFLVGAGVIVLLFYLAIAAQITQASYDIARLQDQQRQLIAEQDQLRYQEVTMQAPAQIQEQATQSGMIRVLPSRYVAAQQVAVDLTAPVGDTPPDTTPLWMRAVAFVLNTAGGRTTALAAGNK